MTVFFDTSVLVAAFLADHEHHVPSLAHLASASGKSSFCAAHSLAEVYAILTRLPGAQRVSPEHALLFVDEVCNRLNLVTLSGPQYRQVAAQAVADHITGGAIYDALILRCAVKCHAQSILTWNIRDFRRIAPELAHRIRMP